MKTRLVIYYLLLIGTIACEKEPTTIAEPPDPPADAKVHIEFVDYAKGIDGRMVGLPVTMGYLDPITQKFIAVATAVTDDNGTCTFTHLESDMLLQPAPVANYHKNELTIPGRYLVDSHAPDYPNPFYPHFVKKDVHDNYFRAYLLLKAETEIHLRQVTDFDYKTQDSSIFIILSNLLTDRSEPTYNHRIPNFPLQQQIALAPGKKLDTVIHVSLIGEAENFIQWEVLENDSSGWDFIWRSSGNSEKKILLSGSKNKITIEF